MKLLRLLLLPLVFAGCATTGSAERIWVVEETTRGGVIAFNQAGEHLLDYNAKLLCRSISYKIVSKRLRSEDGSAIATQDRITGDVHVSSRKHYWKEAEIECDSERRLSAVDGQ
jgi:hypothetical protein